VSSSYANGSLVRCLVQIKDVNQTLIDATTVVVTLTLPDASTSTPSVTHDSVGNYHCDFTTTQTGTHTYKSVSTGVVTVGSSTFIVTA
jgi:hypothetical protein